MSDILANLQPDEPLEPGCYGREGVPGVTVKTVDLALASLIAGRNAVAPLSDAIKAGLGVPLPQGPQFAVAGGVALIGTGPGRWIVVAEEQSAKALLEHLETLAGSFGSATDQSDASILFEIAGPSVRDTLMKMLLIDIDPASFKPGSAATTQAALIGTTFWQIDDKPTYRFLVARSYAVAFVRALAVSAAEFGFELA